MTGASFITWDARDLSDNLSIPLSTISEADYERDVDMEELKSMHSRHAYLPKHTSRSKGGRICFRRAPKDREILRAR